MAVFLSYLLPSLRTLLKVLGTTLALSVLGGGTALYLFQTRLIYPANLPSGSREHVPRPQVFGMEGEEVDLQSADGVKVKAFVILARDKAEERPTVLLLHANAGNVGHRLPIAKVFWQKMRCNVVMLSYRGYGHSEGSPSEKGIKLDAQTCLDYLKSRPDLEKTDVWLYGQSIGGAVAVWLASQNAERVRGLIVENTFLSLPKLIPHLLPFLRPFLPLLLTEIWPSEHSITLLPRSFPVLFLAGKKDELVVPGQMKGLWELCGSESKEWSEYEEGTHNDTCAQPHYFADIASFISKHSSSPPAHSTSPTPTGASAGPIAEKQQDSSSSLSSPVGSSASVESFEFVEVDVDREDERVSALSMGPKEEVEEVVDEAKGNKGRL
ncbi:alpha/beta hydrolase fold-1 domain containing protein [Rhodotorula toruloides]|uniref:Alpha/beta hydrolase fold-1 domain containing protein n=1 Tax=Rhodotorula toruloides TaxID=5286 RepID=A0A511KQ51_RHOTO|nr:alpha/beta hydrolase fold-1 domain containing protein [Rhodotorula toruloides]